MPSILNQKSPSTLPTILANSIWASSLPINGLWGGLILLTLSTAATLGLSIAAGILVIALGIGAGIITHRMSAKETSDINTELENLDPVLDVINKHRLEIQHDCEILIEKLNKLALTPEQEKSKQKAGQNLEKIISETQSKALPWAWKRYAAYAGTIGLGAGSTSFVSFFWGGSVIMTALGFTTASALVTGPVGILIAAIIGAVIATFIAVKYYQSSKAQFELTQQRNKMCSSVTLDNYLHMSDLAHAKEELTLIYQQTKSPQLKLSNNRGTPKITRHQGLSKPWNSFLSIPGSPTKQTIPRYAPLTAPNEIEMQEIANQDPLLRASHGSFIQKKMPSTIPFVINNTLWVSSIPVNLLWGILVLLALPMPLIFSLTIVMLAAVAILGIGTGLTTHYMNRAEITNANQELQSLNTSLQAAEEYKTKIQHECEELLVKFEDRYQSIINSSLPETKIRAIQTIHESKELNKARKLLRDSTPTTKKNEPTAWKRYVLYSISVGSGAGSTIFLSFFWASKAIITALGFASTAAIITGPVGIIIAVAVSIAVAIFVAATHYQSSKTQREMTQQRHEMCKSITLDAQLESLELTKTKRELQQQYRALKEYAAEKIISSSSSSSSDEEFTTNGSFADKKRWGEIASRAGWKPWWQQSPQLPDTNAMPATPTAPRLNL